MVEEAGAVALDDDDDAFGLVLVLENRKIDQLWLPECPRTLRAEEWSGKVSAGENDLGGYGKPPRA